MPSRKGTGQRVRQSVRRGRRAARILTHRVPTCVGRRRPRRIRWQPGGQWARLICDALFGVARSGLRTSSGVLFDSGASSEKRREFFAYGIEFRGHRGKRFSDLRVGPARRVRFDS
eukprot:1771606-Pleurochrysis_carterae.AAC.1